MKTIPTPKYKCEPKNFNIGCQLSFILFIYTVYYIVYAYMLGCGFTSQYLMLFVESSESKILVMGISRGIITDVNILKRTFRHGR